MSEYDLSAYLGVFLDELDEQLQILDEKILELEKDPTNLEIVQCIFRAAHTLKGSSASMGYVKLKEFTHQLENIFEKIRQQQLEVSQELINIIFDSIDVIKQLKDSIVQGNLEEIDISSALAAIEKLLDNDSSNPGNKDMMHEVISSQMEEQLELDKYQQDIITVGKTEGYSAFEIGIELKADAQMKSVRAFIVYNNLSENGEIIATQPHVKQMENEEEFDGNMRFVLLTKQTKNLLNSKLNNISDISAIHIRDIENNDKKTILNEPKEYDVVDEESIHSKVKITPTVRLDVDKLDYLMSLVGELVINQTRLVDVRGRFAEKDLRTESEFEVLNEVTNQLSLVIGELQDGMMHARMLPIEQLFNRFPRLVRDTSLNADKKIEFEMIGKETEIDRTLIEEISDPLIHILRNAIDHGIECAEERIEANKPATGKVTLSAHHKDKHVIIIVKDDGRGIDPKKIREASVEKGLITEEEAAKLTDKEAMFLIFKSGISTAKEITDISGRGVGMDIVKSHLEKVNGIIEIDSKIGEGTTFTIKLPLTLTLSIIRALLVKLGNKTFAIPLVNVLEIIRLNNKDIQMVNNQEIGMIRGRVLPLVRMRERLGIENAAQSKMDKKREFIVVVGIADKRVGIIVDKTLGNQEIVTKPLGAYIGTPPYIAGATIMGDANVGLILDVPSIVRTFGKQIVGNESYESEINNELKEENQILTFKLDSEIFGIEIQRAKDIISVPEITKVVEAPNEVLGLINLRGTMLSVIDLRKRLDLPEVTYTKKARIIVVEYDKQDIGFVVDEVSQVVKVNNLLIEKSQNHPYNHSKLIKRISEFNNQVVFILEFDEIISSVHLLKEDK